MFLTIISDHKLQLYGKVIERTIEAHLQGSLVMNKDTLPGIQRLGTSVVVVNCLKGIYMRQVSQGTKWMVDLVGLGVDTSSWKAFYR